MFSATDVLFSKTQQRILWALFTGRAPEGLSYTELLRRTGGGAGAIHRELRQFAEAGLVREARAGGVRRFAANMEHPVCETLSSITKVLFGPAVPRRSTKPEKLDAATVKDLARKYLWWKTPAEAARMPERLVAQVMNLGDYEDVQQVARALGEDYLREVVKNAEAGQFDERSWSYWNYRLGLARPGKVPPAPKRATGG